MLKKKRPTIDIPVADQSFSITNGGFKEGDILISGTGISIGNQDVRMPSEDDMCVDIPADHPQISNEVSAIPLQHSEVDDFAALSRNSEVRMEDLQMVKIVGRGSGGVVQCVLHRTTKKLLALKVIQLDVTEKVRKQILLELKTLYQADSPYIVKFYGGFFSEGHIHVALELMDAGSLHDVLKNTGAMPEPIIAKIAIQVLGGLNYLHKDRHLIHRDIKPSNLLINRKGEVKVSDFGVSGQLASTISSCVSWVGTVTYMSPERIQGKSYSVQSDIWSFGLSMLELAIGKFPYQGLETVDPSMGFWELLDFIVEQPAPQVPDQGFSREFSAFVDACLQKEPNRRPSAMTLLEHPFIRLHANSPVSLAEYISSRVPEDSLGSSLAMENVSA